MTQTARIVARTTLLVLVGCAENFGTPPIVPGSSVPVSSEGFVGEPVLRVVTQLAPRGNTVWVGTDLGLYRAELDGSSATWFPGHPGFQNEAGDLLARPLAALSWDPTGQVGVLSTNSGVSQSQLAMTLDGGVTFRFLEVPDFLAGRVDDLLAIAATDQRPLGSIVARQGLVLSSYDPILDEWTTSDLPSSPVEFGRFGGATAGRVAVSVRLGLDWAVWRSDDHGRSFQSTGPSLSDEPLAVWPAANDEVVITALRGTGGGLDLVPAAGESFATASIQGLQSAHFAILVEDSGGDVIRTGLVGTAPVDRPAPGGANADLLQAFDGGAWVADAGAELWRVDAATTSFPFEGRELDWSAIAIDPRATGAIYLGDRRGHNVWWVDADDSMTELGSPMFASEIRALFADPATPTGVYGGSFGAHFKPNLGANWVNRSNGQFSYTQFASPVNVKVLAGRPDRPQELWLGSTTNDGPYRSTDGGLNWARVHDGLGEPVTNPSAEEIGLTGVSQVHGFAFLDDEIYMATFRGGVFSFDAGTSRWEQRNQGLLDMNGAAVDTCCYEPLVRQVDVRDVAVSGGSILAATNWGVFRDDTRTGDWVESSDGMTSRDSYDLAVHPDDTDVVLAVSRGNADNPDWLFYSENGGRSWRPVGSTLRARFGEAVVWSDPSRFEAVVLLNRQGAWRVVVAP